MAKFVTNEELWLDTYTKAWKIATENGHPDLRYLDKTMPDPDDKCTEITRGRECRRTFGCSWEEMDADDIADAEEEMRAEREARKALR